MSLKVEDVMRSSVVTIEGEYSARQAAKMMDFKGVSSLVVVSKKKISGIVTEKDLCTRVMAKGRDAEKVKVREIMSQPVMIVRPDMSLESAVQVMLTQGIKKLPVLGGEFGENLVGILSLTDVVMLYPALYATMKQLQEIQLAPVEKDVDFYIS
ncbi:CBS domain-containing protein [Candidatus Bathyarchaeota archaeon]|jgi:signal-transduction protein with cAMP-binding, CBS, and nucleotidyltransferase domain|nr:CBS domain-containing protein [Candidatus Bathyarchaeota archaeon]